MASWLDDLLGKPVQVDGVSQPNRRTLNLVSSALGAFTATDNPSNNSIDVKVDVGTALSSANALSVLGRSANSNGAIAPIQTTALSNEVLRESGGTLGFGKIVAAAINAVTGLSVVGRSANSAGVAADIVAANDGEVLRRAGTTLGFGTVGTSGIANNAITFAKIQPMLAYSLIANGTNASGTPSYLQAATDGHILRRNGTALDFGKIKTNFVTGTATNDNATAGDIGEIIESIVVTGSKIGSFTTGIAKNVTSISLTAGDWDVCGLVQVDGTLTGTSILAGISTTTTNTGTRGDNGVSTPTMPTAIMDISLPIPAKRFSLSATTTIYLATSISFSAGTPGAWGRLTARRVR